MKRWPNEFIFAFGVRLMSIGIAEITKKNVKEVWRRWYIYDKLFGAIYDIPAKDGESRQAWTPDITEVMSFIGSNANINEMTRAQWNKHIMNLKHYEDKMRIRGDRWTIHQYFDAINYKPPVGPNP